jgi:Ca-activated chloride channel family protein
VRGTSNGTHPPAVIVLLSDGGQTAGRVTPQQAGTAARNAHIPIFSIAVGTPDGVVTQKLQGGFSERFQVPMQPQPLELLSRLSGGHFTGGARLADVNPAIEDLGSRVGHRQKKVEISAAAAGAGMAFMLVGAVLSGLWFRRFA